MGRKTNRAGVALEAEQAVAAGNPKVLRDMVRKLIPRPPRPFSGMRRADGTFATGAEEELQEWDIFMTNAFGCEVGSVQDVAMERLPPLFSQGEVLSALRKRKLGEATGHGAIGGGGPTGRGVGGAS